MEKLIELLNEYEIEKEKSEGVINIFTRGEENIVAKSDVNEEWYAVMNAGMFHKQTHICKDRKSLWRKIKHNKDAKKLCQIFNKDFV